MLRFAIATLGCKINQYDSAMIESRLLNAGLERCEFSDGADVYVVNSCTITNTADNESLRMARRARRLNPSARVIVTGCLAQADSGVLEREAAVDAIVGLARPGDLEAAALGRSERRVMVSNLRKERAAIELGAVTLDGRTRGFLKVQEGCDQFCTFCIVPFSRGQSRSVAPRRILDALDGLAQQGVKEAVLTGVHLGGYGHDLDPPISLERLIEMLDERAPLTRLRLSSIDPEELSDGIIRRVAGSTKFCPHFHLPLQAGHDDTLARMRRRYSIADYRGRVERILSLMPEAAIGADVIAGFPGETAQDFAAALDFVASLPLAYLHVFPYSRRSGTTAAKAGNQVAASEIKGRAAALRQLDRELRRAFAARFAGRRATVLFEEHPAGCLRGYTRNYLRVNANGAPSLINQEVEVELSLDQDAQLVGRIAAGREECAADCR